MVGCSGWHRSARSGQNIFGMAFAITDLVDAAGVALTNGTVIMGLDFGPRSSHLARTKRY